jgi:hypothetical protein
VPRIWQGERRKLNVVAGETVHVDPDAVERRRACDRERNDMFRQGDKGIAESSIYQWPQARVFARGHCCTPVKHTAPRCLFFSTHHFFERRMST